MEKIDGTGSEDKINRNRKVWIFLFSVAAAVITKYFMMVEYYDKFLEFLLWLAIGFFAGNSIEHLAGGLKKPPSLPPPEVRFGNKDE